MQSRVNLLSTDRLRKDLKEVRVLDKGDQERNQIRAGERELPIWGYISQLWVAR